MMLIIMFWVSVVSDDWKSAVKVRQSWFGRCSVWLHRSLRL